MSVTRVSSKIWSAVASATGVGRGSGRGGRDTLHVLCEKKEGESSRMCGEGGRGSIDFLVAFLTVMNSLCHVRL